MWGGNLRGNRPWLLVWDGVWSSDSPPYAKPFVFHGLQAGTSSGRCCMSHGFRESLSIARVRLPSIWCKHAKIILLRTIARLLMTYHVRWSSCLLGMHVLKPLQVVNERSPTLGRTRDKESSITPLTPACSQLARGTDVALCEQR